MTRTGNPNRSKVAEAVWVWLVFIVTTLLVSMCFVGMQGTDPPSPPATAIPVVTPDTPVPLSTPVILPTPTPYPYLPPIIPPTPLPPEPTPVPTPVPIPEPLPTIVPLPEPDIRGGYWHRILPGDCLWLLAERIYGHGLFWHIIYEANFAPPDPPGLIHSDNLLWLPALDFTIDGDPDA